MTRDAFRQHELTAFSLVFSGLQPQCVWQAERVQYQTLEPPVLVLVELLDLRTP